MYLHFSNCLFNIKIPNPIRFYCIFNSKITKTFKMNIKYLNIKEKNPQKILQNLKLYSNIACNGLQLEVADSLRYYFYSYTRTLCSDEGETPSQSLRAQSQ